MYPLEGPKDSTGLTLIVNVPYQGRTGIAPRDTAVFPLVSLGKHLALHLLVRGLSETGLKSVSTSILIKWR